MMPATGTAEEEGEGESGIAGAGGALIPPPGDWCRQSYGHERLLEVPGVKGVFLGVSRDPAAGVSVVNVADGWWRWLPGPPDVKALVVGAQPSFRFSIR
jgi:hypothetical protein